MEAVTAAPEWVLEQIGGPLLEGGPRPLQRRLLLGRSPECDWMLADASVSRRHVVLERRRDGWIVLDLGSRAGTCINDHPVAGVPVPLHLHDRLRIGPYRFRVRLQGVATALRSARESVAHTSLGTPILAAEQRLELLVEFAAGAARARDRAELHRLTVEFAQRGLDALAVGLYSTEDPDTPVAVQPPAATLQLPGAAMLDLADRGGVVPSLDAAERPTLTVALRLDHTPEAWLHAVFAAPHPRLKLEAPEFLHALARLAALSAGNLDRRAIAAKIERLQADLDGAREVQNRLLPPTEGQCGALDYALHLHPGRQVAGDLVDLQCLPDGRIAVVLGDVAGAGVGAGFLMAGVLAWLQSVLQHSGDPAAAAAAANAYVAQVGGGRFVSCWMGVFDPAQRRAWVVDAGHGHMRVLDEQGHCHTPALHGTIPLGVDRETRFYSEMLELPVQHRWVLYSDGVIEQRAPTGEEFGTQRLERVLRHSRSPVQDVQAVLAGLELHAGGRPPDDDATLLSLRWRD